jgi:type IX secretion system PorP/SprF family membrane protein
MKTTYTLIILLLLSFQIYAQRDPLYAQYVTNPFVINPAYAGLTNNLSLGVSYRNQWNGMEGSPKTINGNGHMALRYNKMGGGFMFVEDRAGNTSMTEVLASYSYQIAIASATSLSFGMQAGFANYKSDNSKVSAYDATDPLFSADQSSMAPRIGFGVIVKNDRLMAGISVPRMLKSNVTEEGFSYAQYTQHMYATAAYNFLLTERIRFRPSTLLKFVKGAKPSVDLNAAVILLENYQGGVMTRNFNTYGLFAQVRIKNTFVFGYVFEVPVGKKADINFLTHEITLGLRLKALKFHENTLF